ncbi:MAG TPA: LLM class F420-dependent oxidoreductase [Mycobacteriales bacterium]|jgi:probable F420-dependent oxidoreductase|nr:LLM class F420-dependent oxidoreductase [Mycobacteriales bacterium]
MTVDVGRIGVWLRSSAASGSELVGTARELERLGYGAIWLGGANGDLRSAQAMLDATQRITVATGIVSMWTIPAQELAINHARVTAAHPGRFLLGIGASHEALVGERYRRPYSALVSYLDELDAAGVPKSERVLAALGPKVLALAAERSRGAHPYLVTPDYTAGARQVLGSGPLMATEQKVALAGDVEQSRKLGRPAVAPYLKMPNYLNNLRRDGFTDADFAHGGSDRLIDALVAGPDPAAVSARVQAHLDAGADHVCLQVVTADGSLPTAEWAKLAEALPT